MIAILVTALVLVCMLWCAHAWFLGNKLQETKDEIVKANRRNYELQSRLPDDTAVCLCDHGINYHLENNGKCEKYMNYEESLALLPFLRRTAMCECKRYTGPEPLPTYYHPLELTR